jgi:hypothetical protein
MARPLRVDVADGLARFKQRRLSNQFADGHEFKGQEKDEQTHEETAKKMAHEANIFTFRRDSGNGIAVCRWRASPLFAGPGT